MMRKMAVYFIAVMVIWPLLFLTGISSAHAHVDPPIMTFTMYPDMPALNHETDIKVLLVGSQTGFPTLGADVDLVATNMNGKRVETTLQANKDHPGLYTGKMVFSELEMWNLRVDVFHENELDIRNYMVHVMEPNLCGTKIMEDKTFLKMDKNMLGHRVPPRLILEGYIFLVLLLLVTVKMMKRNNKAVKQIKESKQRVMSHG